MWVSGGVCFAYLYHIFQYIFFFSQEKNLVLLNLINRYIKSVTFEKQRHCGKLQSKFLRSANYSSNAILSKLFIQCNTESCCEHITGSINIYLYACVSPLAPVFAMCLWVCVISNQSTSKKPSQVLDLSNLMPCCIKHTARSLQF